MEGVDIDTRNPRSAGGDQKNLLYFPRNAGLLLTNMPILYIMGAYKGKRKCQMENEKDDIQKTKLNDNGTLCTGQKDSLKDSVLSKEYPRQMSIIYNREQENKTMKTSEKQRIGLDKMTNIVYNTTMTNNNNNNERVNEMKKFKTNENDIKRACELANKLFENGKKVWFSIDQNDMSNCSWKVDHSPDVFGTMPLRVIEGGIGALINDLKEACFAHGIMKRPERIGSRNHVRLAINGNPVWTASNGG